MGAAELRDRGYAWLRGVLTPEQVRDARALVEDVVRRLDPPSLHAPEATPIAEGAFVTASGLALPGLLRMQPALEPMLLPERVLDPVLDALGEGARLEVAGALVSDRTRPFFRWHCHIDGIDESERMRAGHWPTVASLRRLLVLGYLDDLDEHTGTLRLLPRRVGEQTAPRGPLDAEHWPGAIEVRARAADAVVLDECTWHAAGAMRREGLRIVLVTFFRVANTPPAPFADPWLEAIDLPSRRGAH
ncbi:MAG: hypothetical protein RMK74_12215 [Myxococcales bacterium]|nr:hypothetical protein [Myxococcales bacterium]